jgi:bacterioferritin-associated ferredoxin
MIVCLCRAVSDRAIHAAVAAGAASPGEVARACGAGTGCGRCWEQLDRLVAEARCASCPVAVGQHV